MNFGLDIDGVLTDIESYQLNKGIPFFKKVYNKEVVNECGKNIQQIFDCTKKEEHKFWSKYLFRYAIGVKARKNAHEYTKYLYSQGHKVYIITSRVFTTKDTFMGKLMRYIVRNWLKRNKIRYEDIVFCDEDKTDAIQKYNIKYMVEDDPDNIEALKNYTQMICINAKYNQNIDDNEVIRCNDFNEVLSYVKNVDVLQIK